MSLDGIAPAFVIPAPILAEWRAAGDRGRTTHEAWRARSQKLETSEIARLGDPIDEAARSDIADAIQAIKTEFSSDAPSLATRVSSQKVLEKLVPAISSLVGGSADLTGSNGTRTSHHVPVQPDDFSGTYIHYGVREHGMAAAMNGMALHGGIVPYGATFLVFTGLLPPIDPFIGADGAKGRLCDDP